MCFDSVYNLVWNISHTKKNAARYCHKRTQDIHVKCPLFLSDLNCIRSPPMYVSCSCPVQYSTWNFFRIRMRFIESEFLFYYHCPSVYGVQLTVSGIIRYIYQSLPPFVYWINRPLADISRHPASSSVNDEPFAPSYQDNSPWYTPDLRTPTASYIHHG